MSIDALRSEARATLPGRPSPPEALRLMRSGAGFLAWRAAGLPVLPTGS